MVYKTGTKIYTEEEICTIQEKMLKHQSSSDQERFQLDWWDGEIIECDCE